MSKREEEILRQLGILTEPKKRAAPKKRTAPKKRGAPKKAPAKVEQREDRWRLGKLYQARDYRFHPEDHEVVDLSGEPEVVAQFVYDHHYLGTLPKGAKILYGLWHKPSKQIVGIAAYGQPGTPPVLKSSFPNLEDLDREVYDPERDLWVPKPLKLSKHATELIRLVLLDEVPRNGESWFVDQTFSMLRERDQRGVISFSDPVAGHVGTVYQALSAFYTGMSKPSYVWRFKKDGREFANRDRTKIRSADPCHGSQLSIDGWKGAVERLIARGARKPRRRECLRSWLDEILPTIAVREKSGGKHRYLWGLTKGQRGDIRQRAKRGEVELLPYPKQGRVAPNPHIRSSVTPCGQRPKEIEHHFVERKGRPTAVLMLDAHNVRLYGPELFYENRCPLLAGFRQGPVSIKREAVSWSGAPVHAESYDLQDLARRVGLPMRKVEDMLVKEGHAWARAMKPQANPPAWFNPPAWAERLMKKHWLALSAAVGADRMPSAPGATEFGCGHYGCVWPTASGQVIKITSDETEARFVAACLSMGGVDGLVEYYQIVQLPDQHRRRPVYVIWRAEAWDVGKMQDLIKHGDHYVRRQLEEVFLYQRGFTEHARAVRDYLNARQRRHGDAADVALQAWRLHGEQPAWSRGNDLMQTRESSYRYQTTFAKAGSWIKGADRPAAHLAACSHLAVMLENSSVYGYMIGRALGQALDRGILLADVHGGNVGRIKIKGHGDLSWGITDPGHAVFLDPKWFAVEIPQLVTQNPRWW